MGLAQVDSQGIGTEHSPILVHVVFASVCKSQPIGD